MKLATLALVFALAPAAPAAAQDDYTPIVLPTVPGAVRSDDVYPIDFDRDGRAEFLVLHGHSIHPAPIQLIKLR